MAPVQRRDDGSVMTTVLEKASVPDFIKDLKKKYEVYAPVKQINEYAFKSLSGLPDDRVCLEYPTAILPPKKIFYPQFETMFSHRDNEMSVPQPVGNKAVAGVHLYDAHSLLLLDEALNYKFDDYYYSLRRENTIIVCVSHPEGSPAFDEDVGLDANGGYDLFLEDAGNTYRCIPGSEAGKDLISSPLFGEADPGEVTAPAGPDKLFSDLERLSRAVKNGRESKVWSELAKTCFGCGVCSFVCPLCYCYELEDIVEMDLETGSRKRHWDSCFLPEFSLVAGHNFRDQLEDRMYHWYFHKFVQFPEITGKLGCVGCGRCVHYCPAKIDFRETLERLVNELEKNEE